MKSRMDNVEVKVDEMAIDMEEVKSQLQSLGNSVDEILNIILSTPAPTASSTPAPSIACTDRKGSWTYGSNKEKNWCGWARKTGTAEEIANKCKQKELYDDCPKTCGKDGCTS
mmetsp:Transcript_23330/g.34709  ORF Transcript_23330/g.34709 Transcript_23330/m.34709 type:complete len:113 (+) Transcript_23330:748-1086(+)